jgi:hypothetical protein
MRGLIALLVGLSLGLGREPAFAWARAGHEVVALIAERLISPETQAKVRQLLAKGGDKDLVSVACWADEVVLASRGEGPLSGNPEAQEFNTKFPKSRTWHFINLPLGTVSFEEVSKFTSPDDIVHAIGRSIQVLESPEADPQGLTKGQALRLLVHLVGDIHQPLHCGTGFYKMIGPDAAQLITYPEEAFGHPTDRGGNLLFYGTNPTDQLHALWDAVIVAKIDGTVGYEALGNFLLQDDFHRQMTETPGDYHHWAEAWAIESVRIATLAYLGIAFENAAFDTNNNLVRIGIKLPVHYLETNRAYARLQLTKAGVRLAQLLDNITWQNAAEPVAADAKHGGGQERVPQAGQTLQAASDRLRKEQCSANPAEMPPNPAHVVLPGQARQMKHDLLPAREKPSIRYDWPLAARDDGWSGLNIHTTR